VNIEDQYPTPWRVDHGNIYAADSPSTYVVGDEGWSRVHVNPAQYIVSRVNALSALTADLHKLITQWQKAAETYLKQHPIPPGSSPAEITPEQQSSANSAGAFRVCAHELKNLLTKHTRP
jgi:hypothetical protein